MVKKVWTTIYWKTTTEQGSSIFSTLRWRTDCLSTLSIKAESWCSKRFYLRRLSSSLEWMSKIRLIKKIKKNFFFFLWKCIRFTWVPVGFLLRHYFLKSFQFFSLYLRFYGKFSLCTSLHTLKSYSSFLLFPVSPNCVSKPELHP